MYRVTEAIGVVLDRVEERLLIMAATVGPSEGVNGERLYRHWDILQLEEQFGLGF